MADRQSLPIVDMRSLAETVDRRDSEGLPFSIEEAVVSYPPAPLFDTFAVSDGTASLRVTDGMFWPKLILQSGDRLRISGVVVKHSNGLYHYAKATNIVILAHGTAPAPVVASASEINAGKVLDRLVTTEGRVIDVFRDEIDSRFLFLVLADGQDFVYTSILAEAFDVDHLFSLLDAVVRITGICSRLRPHAHDRLIDISLSVNEWSADAVRTLTPPPADPFSAPPFNGHIYEALQRPGLGTFRRKVSGTVIAVWGKNTALVRTENDTLSKIGFATETLPRCGDSIEAVGGPETDLYSFNLSRAVWRRSANKPKPFLPPQHVPIGRLFTDKRGKAAFNPAFHGQVLRFSGKVLSLPTIGDEQLSMACDGITLPIDLGTNPEVLEKIEIGCTIDVTGVCVMKTENWRPQLPFPQIKGFALVIRAADDVRVLSHPSWWTPSRLLLVIAALVAALVTLAGWNRILRKIIERRSRELSREQIGRERSETQTRERTRLAVELHDTIAQNLTGASFEINAAQRLLPNEPDPALGHLERAARTLKSCRDELRNCIWDLRNRTLETSDMNKAIRFTLEPHIGDASLDIRFNVPRKSFSENSAHTVLQIIRELSINAVRHGSAQTIRIDGSLENGLLSLSVTDDGSGFDPENVPGLREGHFGLQGIRERIKRFNGKLTIESTSGRTRVEITMPLFPDGSGSK